MSRPAHRPRREAPPGACRLSTLPPEVMGGQLASFLDDADVVHLAQASKGIHADVASDVGHPFLAGLLGAQARFYRPTSPQQFEQASQHGAECVRAIQSQLHMREAESHWMQRTRGRISLCSIYVTRQWVQGDSDGTLPHDILSLQSAAALQVMTGNVEHAVSVMNWSVALFPGRQLNWMGLAQALIEEQSLSEPQQRDFSRAVAAAENAVALAGDETADPSSAEEVLAVALMLGNDPGQAVARFSARLCLTTQAMLQHQLGASADVVRSLLAGPLNTYASVARTARGAKSPQAVELALRIAIASAKLGDTNGFFAWVAVVLDSGERPYGLMRLAYSPLVDEVRSDPRWPCLMRSLCATPAQRVQFDARVPMPVALRTAPD